MAIKSKDMVLLSVTTVVTLFICLMLLRTYAPALLGIPIDLQMVKTAKEVPPFFESVFRQEDHTSESFIIPDPILKRAKPLFPDLGGVGPNDILGFRNRYVPSVADLVIIGDSQTYGNNAHIDDNWPHQMGQQLKAQGKSIVRYDMAVGGWGAIEYLEAFQKALYLKPKTIVVAFYTGNDSLESFRAAYSNERWKELRPDNNLVMGDIPTAEFPAPVDKQWLVEFGDGVKTIMTPELRLVCNLDHPVSNAGYQIMKLVAKQISQLAKQQSISVFFTLIPTKEFVYSNKIRAEIETVPEDYLELVENEERNIFLLSKFFKEVEHSRYIDVVQALQQAALSELNLYPEDTNGHPVSEGYRVIAEEIATNIAIENSVPNELFAITLGGSNYQLAIFREEKLWIFLNPNMVAANGWVPGEIPTVNPRDVANIERGGIISSVDIARFGPKKI